MWYISSIHHVCNFSMHACQVFLLVAELTPAQLHWYCKCRVDWCALSPTNKLINKLQLVVTKLHGCAKKGLAAHCSFERIQLLLASNNWTKRQTPTLKIHPSLKHFWADTWNLKPVSKDLFFSLKKVKIVRREELKVWAQQFRSKQSVWSFVINIQIERNICTTFKYTHTFPQPYTTEYLFHAYSTSSHLCGCRVLCASCADWFTETHYCHSMQQHQWYIQLW